jgi:hypothetical protein
MHGVEAMTSAQTSIPSYLPIRQASAFALILIVVIAILPL